MICRITELRQTRCRLVSLSSNPYFPVQLSNHFPSSKSKYSSSFKSFFFTCIQNERKCRYIFNSFQSNASSIPHFQCYGQSILSWFSYGKLMNHFSNIRQWMASSSPISAVMWSVFLLLIVLMVSSYFYCLPSLKLFFS